MHGCLIHHFPWFIPLRFDQLSVGLLIATCQSSRIEMGYALPVPAPRLRNQ